MITLSRKLGLGRGAVTLLGDAIHNMTPMGGIGANTALRDADLLRRTLTAVRDGATQIPAVHDYEQQMLNYGFAAVKLSLRNARGAASTNPLARAAFRGALPNRLRACPADL